MSVIEMKTGPAMLAPETQKTLKLENFSCLWKFMENFTTLVFEPREPPASGSKVFHW